MTRHIERVLVAARAGEGMPALQAIEASGREAVLLMAPADEHRAWIDEVTYAVHVSPGADGRWPDPQRAASAALDAGCDAVLPLAPGLSGHAHFLTRLYNLNTPVLGPGAETVELCADWRRSVDLGRTLGLRVLPVADLPEAPEAAREALEEFFGRWGFPARFRVRLPGGWVDTQPVHDLEEARRLLAERQGTGALSVVHLPAASRAVEVPFLGDGSGWVLTLGDREVTAFRGGEPAVIEAPAPDLAPAVAARLHEEAMLVAARLRWFGPGAAVFAVTEDGRSFFRELRPGLLPWYGVTERVYGVDLVDASLRLAEGDRLGWVQSDIAPAGAAMEVRISVEGPDPEAPPPEQVALPLEDDEDAGPPPAGIAVLCASIPEDDLRWNLTVSAGDRVMPGDVLGGVVIAGPTRQACIVRARSALNHLDIGGILHTGAWVAGRLGDRAFWRGDLVEGDA